MEQIIDLLFLDFLRGYYNSKKQTSTYVDEFLKIINVEDKEFLDHIQRPNYKMFIKYVSKKIRAKTFKMPKDLTFFEFISKLWHGYRHQKKRIKYDKKGRKLFDGVFIDNQFIEGTYHMYDDRHSFKVYKYKQVDGLQEQENSIQQIKNINNKLDKLIYRVQSIEYLKSLKNN